MLAIKIHDTLTNSKNELELNNLFLSIFNSPPGNFKNGDRGLACIPNREKDFKESIFESIRYSKILQCNKVHVMSGTANDLDASLSKKVYIQNLKLKSVPKFKLQKCV